MSSSPLYSLSLTGETGLHFTSGGMTLSRTFTPLLLLFHLLSSLPSSEATQANVTVDDQNGDEVTRALPTYSPSSEWKLGSTCGDCLIKPDAYDAYDTTWHDSTRRPGDDPFTIEISFTGFAIYAFIILPGYVYNAALTTNIQFRLDGNIVGSFNNNPGYNPNYVYNYVAYSNASLENTTHTFVIESIADTDQSVVLFDRLVYTTGDPDGAVEVKSTWVPDTGQPVPVITATSSQETNTLPTPSASYSDDSSAGNQKIPSSDSKSTSRGAIIGGSIAGSIVVIFSFFAFLCIRRRRRKALGGNSAPFLGMRKKRPTTMSHGSIDSERGVISIRQSSAKSASSDWSRTESLAVAPASSTVNGKCDAPRPLPFPHDPFRRDEIDEKLERIVRPPPARSQISTWGGRVVPDAWDRHRRDVSYDPSLLNHIATLQAEVDRLRDRDTISDVPPPYH